MKERKFRCSECGNNGIKCRECDASSYRNLDYKPSRWIHLESEEDPYSCDNKLGPDLVNHPPHYESKNGLETITVIEAFTDGLVGIEATDTGNVIKYICRWKKKNGLQDLQKAQWYLNHLIRHVEIEESKNKKEK